MNRPIQVKPAASEGRGGNFPVCWTSGYHPCKGWWAHSWSQFYSWLINKYFLGQGPRVVQLQKQLSYPSSDWGGSGVPGSPNPEDAERAESDAWDRGKELLPPYPWTVFAPVLPGRNYTFVWKISLELFCLSRFFWYQRISPFWVEATYSFTVIAWLLMVKSQTQTTVLPKSAMALLDETSCLRSGREWNPIDINIYWPLLIQHTFSAWVQCSHPQGLWQLHGSIVEYSLHLFRFSGL